MEVDDSVGCSELKELELLNQILLILILGVSFKMRGDHEAAEQRVRESMLSTRRHIRQEHMRVEMAEGGSLCII